MKSAPLFFLTLIAILFFNQGCEKNDNSAYNPYSIAEPDPPTLTAEEIDIIHAQQIIDGTAVVPELIRIGIQSLIAYSELDSIVGNQATVRTGCPCIDYVPDPTTGGGVLTLTFDDGTNALDPQCTTPGVGLLPKTYRGSLEFVFDGPINLTGQTFSMSPINNFRVENYAILTYSDWTFTWDVFNRYFFGGFDSQLVVKNLTDNNSTIYEANPNSSGDEIILARFLGAIPTDPTGLVDKEYELNSYDFSNGVIPGLESTDFLKVTSTSSITATSEEYLLMVGDYDGSLDLDPIVVDPSECGCYINGSMWIGPFDNSSPTLEYNWGYTQNLGSQSDVCDEWYLRRRFSGDPNGMLLQSEACQL